MKKLLSILLLFFSFTVAAQIENVIPGRPSPANPVNDFTGNFLLREQVDALNNKLIRYADSTSTQIVIVVVDDLKGYSAADYALAILRKWGVGGKDFNNGAVILVSTGGTQGNRKVWIATGYGLEGAVTDLVAHSIIDNELLPNFRQGNYYRGLDEATDAIFKAAEGRYKAPEGYGRKKKGFNWVNLVFIIGIIIFLFIGRNGGRGGGYASRRGYTGWGWGGLLGGLGSGGWGSGGSGGGGWSGGGGGGFSGGFGGGSGGGGGAGGNW